MDNVVHYPTQSEAYTVAALHGDNRLWRNTPMAQITIEVPEDLAKQLDAVSDRLPGLLMRVCNPGSPVPDEVYRYILDFLASNPSPQAMVDFQLSPAMQERVSALLEKNRAQILTAAESAELDGYERLNRFVRKFKIQTMQDLQAIA